MSEREPISLASRGGEEQERPAEGAEELPSARIAELGRELAGKLGQLAADLEAALRGGRRG
jgi:hypothetical protein